ncbi:MAG: class I SAM-dependent methyltransferase [Calditerrivibrio sp.]|nr:class I SAM-dependent methyltransferase [Calditerrivibrio sp.]
MWTNIGGESPHNFNYKLLDFGNGRKLEQFGSYIVDRPSQIATNKPYHPELWDEKVAYFDAEKGWQFAEGIYKEWIINVLDISVKLKFSPSGQLGIFPEQYPNWIFLRKISDNISEKITILNGFAYTGISTLFTINGINETVHVDGSSSAINWAKENFKINYNSSGAKFINEDMLTFLSKEIRRGKKYNAFIFDPPEFGRGPKGEWSLKKDLPKLIDAINSLAYNPIFLIFTTHSQWLNKKELVSMMKKIKFIDNKYEIFDLIISTEEGANLNLGISFRWSQV